MEILLFASNYYGHIECIKYGAVVFLREKEWKL